MGAMTSHITSLTIVYSSVYSGADKKKHQSSASLAFARGIHRSPLKSRTNGQRRGKCFHLMTSSCFTLTQGEMFNWNTTLNNLHWQMCQSYSIRIEFRHVISNDRQCSGSFMTGTASRRNMELYFSWQAFSNIILVYAYMGWSYQSSLC